MTAHRTCLFSRAVIAVLPDPLLPVLGPLVRWPHTVADIFTVAEVHVLATACTGLLLKGKRLPVLAASIPPVDHFAYVLPVVLAQALPNTAAAWQSFEIGLHLAAFLFPGRALSVDEVEGGHTNLELVLIRQCPYTMHADVEDALDQTGQELRCGGGPRDAMHKGITEVLAGRSLATDRVTATAHILFGGINKLNASRCVSKTKKDTQKPSFSRFLQLKNIAFCYKTSVHGFHRRATVTSHGWDLSCDGLRPIARGVSFAIPFG